MKISLYQDYVHNNGVLLRRLIETFGKENVDFIDANDITQNGLKKFNVLVMPGGADLYNCEKLNGACNQKIKNFVENGGCYLGICAGAYYASHGIKWGINTSQEITGTRELAFFNGEAQGPIYEFLEDGDIEKSWKNIVPVNFQDATELVFYEAGPLFHGTKNTDIIAHYDSLPHKPAAIISCPIKKGLAILSSPHIEYTAKDLQAVIYKHRNHSYEWDNALISKNLPEDGQLWHKVCHRIKKHIQKT